MTFYSGSDWQQSSEPLVTRKVHLENDANDTYYLWPVADTNWDTLADGDHPVLAVGRKANRPQNITATVITYDSATEIATLNVADKQIVRAKVINILTYDGQAVDAHVNTVYPGDPVYVDDSTVIYGTDNGCTLSFSPLNDTDVQKNNPLAGYVWWCQDEFDDEGVAGPNTSQGINQPETTDTTEVLTLCVMLVNDHGWNTDWT